MNVEEFGMPFEIKKIKVSDKQFKIKFTIFLVKSCDCSNVISQVYVKKDKWYDIFCLGYVRQRGICMT